MKRAFFTDTLTGSKYDLAALVEQHEEVTIGRFRNGNVIGLGEANEDLQRRKTESSGIQKSDVEKLRRLFDAVLKVSRQHALLRYGDYGLGEGFYLKDQSSNGTYINSDLYRLGDWTKLRHEDIVSFGGVYDMYFQEVLEEENRENKNDTSVY